ncbi:hypothetical protein [Paraburkholderia tropica]|uniref:hypothetical protein n=1 Tax=Paraburkholderia tropica TaxID=92647 RepID=UPI000F554A29|nr:hypothetical protein [Paraburkholderia tropica]RQN40800.1 hypothetical protein EHZ25_00625 [Paraburkholderia tropica]
MTAIAVSHAEAGEASLLVDATGAIRFCNEKSNCRSVVPTGELKKAIDDGYEHVSVVDIYKNGNQQIVATSEGANECSKFFSFDPTTFKFSVLKFSDRDICNYQIARNHLISSYKLDSKQYEDVYELKDGTFQLALRDGCVGCDQITRSIYKDGKLSETLLVTNQASYTQRQPVTTSVTTDKAWLYADHQDSARTKMYLLKGDKVQLIEFDDSNGLWYFVKYLSKEHGAISKWIKCEDLTICK